MNPSNLLVIMSDEHQGRAMGCPGHPFVQTPHLDRLAAEGVRFTNAYTPSPICVPARASFATGRYVHQIRHWDNAMPYCGETPGWGHALQKRGVPVESIGKLHYRDIGDADGFDVKHNPMMVVDGVGMVWGSLRREAERHSPSTRMLGPKIGAGESAYTAYDVDVVARTKSWLTNHQADDAPWCLYVGLVAPHFPLVVPQPFFDMYPPGSIPEPKLHPRDGYVRHPWVDKQNAVMNSEATFVDEEERQAALSAYYGLCSWLDHNVGQILATLEETGLADTTTVIYTSDHGDNAGARGLWGKSNMYEESAHIPMILRGPNVTPGVCETAVSLIDVSQTIATHFGVPLETANAAADLATLANAPDDMDRPVFSEYHAIGAVSGAFMIRQGRWKLIHYHGFADELFDLETDPEELINLAENPEHQTTLLHMHALLRDICDPEAVNAQAFADQDALIARFGGREAALKLGAKGATPPPEARP